MKNKKGREPVDEGATDLLQQISGSAEDVILVVDEKRAIRSYLGGPQTPRRLSKYGGLLSGDIYEILKGPVESVFESGKPCSVESSVPERGVWLHTRLTPITEQAGKISAVLCITRDISELKRKEKLIAHSRAEWIQAIDAMPDFLAVIDTHFRIRKANRALAEHLGIGLVELQGRICHQTFGTKCPPELCPIRRSGQTGNSASADFQSELPGNSSLVTVSPLTDESGNTTGCLYIARHLVGRSNATEIRKKNAEDLKLLLSKAEYVVTMQDQNGKYLSIRALPGNIGLPEAIVGKTPHDFFETGPAERICERIKQTIEAGRDQSVSCEIEVGGQTFHLVDHISPVFDETGKVSSVMTLSKIKEHPENPEGIHNESQELTTREREILKLISSGLTTNQIAEKLFISRKTVETHRSRIMNKVGVRKTSALVRYALKAGLF